MKGRWAWALLTPPLAVALILFVGPLLYLVYVSLHAASPSELYGDALTLRNYTALLGDSFYLTIIQRTLATATVILALCLFIGYPVAYFVARLPLRRRMIEAMTIRPVTQHRNVRSSVRCEETTIILSDRYD